MNELDKLYDNVAEMSMKKLGISKRTALLRVKALHASGILGKFGSPSELPFQIAIDAAMQIPQLGEKEDAPELGKCEHQNIKREDGLDECLDCGVRNF